MPHIEPGNRLPMGRTAWDDRWLAGLEWVMLALILLAAGGALVQLAGGGPDWLITVGQISAVAGILSLMLYLDVGGGDKMDGSKAGMASVVLLVLLLLANLADVFFEMDSPAWRVARGAVGAGVVVCFVAYVVIRQRQRRVTTR
jgi:hypothetical protein